MQRTLFQDAHALVLQVGTRRALQSAVVEMWPCCRWCVLWFVRLEGECT
jgi:hypothetical protein